MVSTPKLLVLLAVFSLFEITDAKIKCYTCEDAGETKKHSKKCAGSKDWAKTVKVAAPDCAEGIKKCISVFNAKGGVVMRECLDPKKHPDLDILFKEHICVEKRPEIPKAYPNGVTACACDKDNCNAGMDSASGIEVKIVMILGSPLLLLMINHFF